MSKRKRTSKIEKWIKEGRGSGTGKEYKPWLKIQDVSSLGRSTRLKGIKTNRQHEFLADLERNYHKEERMNSKNHPGKVQVVSNS